MFCFIVVVDQCIALNLDLVLLSFHGDDFLGGWAKPTSGQMASPGGGEHSVLLAMCLSRGGQTNAHDVIVCWCIMWSDDCWRLDEHEQEFSI